MPIGFSGSRRPARLSLIADDSASIALSWPKTSRFSDFSRSFSTSASSLETFFGGMRAIFATTASISFEVMVLRRRLSGRRCCAAPASSITSIALSGSLRSWMYRADRSTAERIASAV